MTRPNIAGNEFGSTGGITDPGDAKTKLGHTAEIVPFQEENFWQNRQDEFLANVEVNGIPEWDTGTTYVTNGLTLASNGLIYQSQNGTNQGNDPTADVGTNWVLYNQFFMAEYKRISGTSAILSVASGVNVFDDDKRWLLCDGQAVDRTTFANLFARIGVAFGNGDGSTTFNLPDRRGRASIDVGTGDASDATAHTLGGKEGSETQAYETSIPITGYGTSGGNIGSVPSGRMVVGSGSSETGETLESLRSAGSSQPIASDTKSNLQPSLADGYTFIFSGIVP